MPIKFNQPSIIEAEGTKPKRIEEYIGRVNSNTAAVSVARMVSPPGWQEPGQRPAFDEYTVVLNGRLRVESDDGTLDVRAGEAVITQAGQWVRYSTPEPEGAEYIAVCLPAFAPDTVHRGDEIVLREPGQGLARAFELLTHLPDDFLAQGRNDTPPQQREAL